MVIFSIEYTVEIPKADKEIKIDLPWNVWLKTNKNNLPYQVRDINKQIGENLKKTVDA